MYRSDYDFFLKYLSGKINRKLTEKEYEEVRASMFAMYLLIPEETIINVCGGIEEVNKINYYDSSKIQHLANIFQVPYSLMAVRLELLKKEKNKLKPRILKKEGNIIYLGFK